MQCTDLEQPLQSQPCFRCGKRGARSWCLDVLALRRTLCIRRSAVNRRQGQRPADLCNGVPSGRLSERIALFKRFQISVHPRALAFQKPLYRLGE